MILTRSFGMLHIHFRFVSPIFLEKARQAIKSSQPKLRPTPLKLFKGCATFCLASLLTASISVKASSSNDFSFVVCLITVTLCLWLNDNYRQVHVDTEMFMFDD